MGKHTVKEIDSIIGYVNDMLNYLYYINKGRKREGLNFVISYLEEDIDLLYEDRRNAIKRRMEELKDEI